MADVHADKNQDEWNEETVYGPSTVIAALDQIEDLVESSRAFPLSASIMINKAEILDLLDQAREALPEDLVAADAVVADADAVLGRADSAAETRIAEANSRASQIRSDAEEEAERTHARADAEATALISQARADAEATIADANAQAERIVSTENIVRMAEDRAREIVSEAKRSATQLREGADDYVATSLDELARLISDVSRRTEAGRRAIAERRGVDVTDVDLSDE